MIGEDEVKLFGEEVSYVYIFIILVVNRILLEEKISLFVQYYKS